MNDGDLLFEAIRAEPSDLTVRLIYADWCEEQGELPLADFIRLQCSGEEGAKADALLYRHRMRWDGAILRQFQRGPLRGLVSARRGPVHRWEYHRGFIESLTVQPSAFLAHGDELRRIGPLVELRLVREKVPWEQLADSPHLGGLRRIVARRCDRNWLNDHQATHLHLRFGGATVLRHWLESRRAAPPVTREQILVAGRDSLQIVITG